MSILILRGISLKGKNRVKEHGDRWVLVESHPLTPFPKNRYMIKSEKSQTFRWISQINDPDFEIVCWEDI